MTYPNDNQTVAMPLGVLREYIARISTGLRPCDDEAFTAQLEGILSRLSKETVGQEVAGYIDRLKDTLEAKQQEREGAVLHSLITNKPMTDEELQHYEHNVVDIHGIHDWEQRQELFGTGGLGDV